MDNWGSAGVDPRARTSYLLHDVGKQECWFGKVKVVRRESWRNLEFTEFVSVVSADFIYGTGGKTKTFGVAHKTC